MAGLGTCQGSGLAIAGEQPLATQGDCMGSTGSLTQPLATSQHSCRAALSAALWKKVSKARAVANARLIVANISRSAVESIATAD